MQRDLLKFEGNEVGRKRVRPPMATMGIISSSPRWSFYSSARPRRRNAWAGVARYDSSQMWLESRAFAKAAVVARGRCPIYLV